MNSAESRSEGKQWGLPAAAGGAIFVVSRAQTLGAWPMPGGERCGFIQKEELGVAPGCHHLAMAPFELEHAVDPSLEPPIPPDLAVIVVKQSAVAQQRAALGRGDDGSERRDAILSGHAIRLFKHVIGRTLVPSKRKLSGRTISKRGCEFNVR